MLAMLFIPCKQEIDSVNLWTEEEMKGDIWHDVDQIDDIEMADQK